MIGPSPRWTIRRRLIHASVIGGFSMIIAGGIGLFQDRFTGELVYGGVTLVSAVISAYVTMGTFDDRWQKDGSPDG
jgi:lipoprotein signal peptidase